MALDLGRLQAHALGNDQAGAAAHAVGLDPVEVAVARHLLVLCPIAVDAHGTVASDDIDLLVAGQGLEVLDPLVESDLLLVPLHLLEGGLVGCQLELAADHVRYEHAEGLGGATRRADGAGEVDVGVLGAVRIALDLDITDALQGRDQDPLGEDGQPRPQGLVEGHLLAGEGHGLDDLAGDVEGRLLAVHLLGGLAYAFCDAHGPHQVLHSLGEVHRHGDLHDRLGVQTHGPCTPCDVHALVETAD